MLVVISPAKKQDFTKSEDMEVCTMPPFPEESQQLIETLKELSKQDLSLLMSVSSTIAELNYKRYREFKLPFTNKNAKQALLAFKGDVYASMKVDTFTRDDFLYAQNCLRILSGLYGLLKPLDLIQPYRLEMKTELATSDAKNLYEFWNTKITNLINQSMAEQKEDVLINLASEEYFKVIHTDKLNGRVVTPIFKEKKDDGFKIIGLLAKRARGMMSRYIIQNKLNKPEQLLNFNEEGYGFNDVLSDKNTFVFTR